MTGTVRLRPRMDISAATQLVTDLRGLDGDIRIDASEVTHLGALCLQALLAASRMALAAGHRFEITGVTDRVAEQMKVMGTSPEGLMEGAR